MKDEILVRAIPNADTQKITLIRESGFSFADYADVKILELAYMQDLKIKRLEKKLNEKNYEKP